jgi:hypothetical protein
LQNYVGFAIGYAVFALRATKHANFSGCNCKTDVLQLPHNKGGSLAMTVEELRKELETIVFNLTSSGFENIDSGKVEKLNILAVAAGELGMNEGKRLIKNLSGVLKAIEEGKSKSESGSLRLTALEFYVKNLSGSENTEDI